jgi:hypothetical protein
MEGDMIFYQVFLLSQGKAVEVTMNSKEQGTLLRFRSRIRPLGKNQRMHAIFLLWETKLGKKDNAIWCR